jgi:hypothetical protein
MDVDLEALVAEHGFELVEPWSLPSPGMRAVVEALCGWLDSLPGPAWGCRMQLWRVWSSVPVIR